MRQGITVELWPDPETGSSGRIELTIHEPVRHIPFGPVLSLGVYEVSDELLAAAPRLRTLLDEHGLIEIEPDHWAKLRRVCLFARRADLPDTTARPGTFGAEWWPVEGCVPC